MVGFPNCFWWHTNSTYFSNQKHRRLISTLLETPSNMLLCGHMNLHEWDPVIILEMVLFHLKSSCHHN